MASVLIVSRSITKIKNNKFKIIIASIIAVLIIIIGGIFIKDNNNNNGNSSNNNGGITKKEGIKIKESETKKINYTKFNNGLVSLDIPEGWKVDVLGDCIHYTIKAYNPEDPAYQPDGLRGPRGAGPGRHLRRP